MPTISFLVLTYNSSAYIYPFFDSLLKFTEKEITNGSHEIVIIDNASTDETVDAIKKYFVNKQELFSEDINDKKGIRLFRDKNNLGYAAGINKAASFSHGEILIVINPDSQLLEADFEALTAQFDQHKKMAIAGMRLVDDKGIAEKTAGKFYNPLTFLMFTLGFEDLFALRFAPKITTLVDFVSGGFVAFRASEFQKLNGYDEDYFMYVEDMDICFRAKKMGLKTYYLPIATIRHKGQGSSSREFAITQIYKGLQLFYKKHGSFFSELYVKNLLSIKAAFIIFIGSILGKHALVRTYIRALSTIQ